MAQVTRIKVTQPDGETKKPVAFLSDIKLNTVEAGDLITVTTDTVNTKATVSVDSTKLSLENGNVKINTPLEFKVQATTPTETTGLRAVSDGGETKLYWGKNVIEAHNPQEGYVTTADFLAHTGNSAKDVKHVTDDQLAALDGIEADEKVITDTTFNSVIGTIETAIEALEDVTSGYTGEGAIKTAVDAVDAKANATLNDVIGAWTTISDKTVKAAIEENKAAIAGDLSEVKAGTSGTGVTVTIGAKSNKSQTVAVSVQDGTTTQKGIVQLANAHDDSDTTKAATGSTVASAINTFDTNVIGSWTESKYTDATVKSVIESLAAISMFKVVEELPTTGETNTIYIVKPADKTEGPYAEWIWVDNKWEKIGDTDIQLQNYYKKDEIGGTWSESNTLSAYVDTQDNAIKATVDTDEKTSSDGHVTVALTGTVGNHGLTVTTSDIASASALTTAEGKITTLEGKLDGISGTVKAYVDAADTALDGRLTTAEGKLTTIEGKLEGLPTGKTIEQAIEDAVDVEKNRAMAVESGLDTRLGTAETSIGTLSTLTTDVKNNLVDAINEVDAHADTAQTTADSALAKADTAVQTATGDGNINATVSDAALSVGVKTGSILADILSVCTITTEEE